MALTVVFRCDGGGERGLGHVSRCLALAEGLSDLGVRSHFVGALPVPLPAWLDRAGVSHEAVLDGVAPVTSLNLALRNLGSDSILCIDSYELDEACLMRLRDFESRTMLLDDFAALAVYPARAVLNFGARAVGLSYPPRPIKYLGPAYALFRRSLRAIRQVSRSPAPAVGRVLIAIGGADRYDVSWRAALAAKQVLGKRVEVRVVASSRSPRTAELQTALSTMEDASFFVNVDGLAPHLAWADIGIVGGGLTKYEAAFARVPTVTLASTEGEQADTEVFAQYGLTVDAGLAASLDGTRLADSVERLVATRDPSQIVAQSVAVFGEDPTRMAAASLLRDFQ